MKIRLIYFDIDTGYYPGFHHGLAFLSGTLKHAGHEIIFDHLSDISLLERCAKNIADNKTDIIALSFTSNQRKYVRAFLDRIPSTRAILIAGGIHASLVKENIFAEFPSLDGVCIGEGELPFIMLCGNISKGIGYQNTPGFFFRKDGAVIKNPVPGLGGIDDLPPPDYGIFNYRMIIKDNGGVFPMLLSRGCPFDCSYCCNHALRDIYPAGRNYVRIPSPARAVEIIKNNLKLYPETKKIDFSDDTFTLDKKWLAEFGGIYKREIGLPFLCNGRIETVDPSVLKTLQDSGCVFIWYGVETGSHWLRKYVLNKKHSDRDIADVFAATRKAGIKSGSFNMIGMPFETEQMALATLRFNMALRPSFGRVFYFYPYPGTRLYDICGRYGLLSEKMADMSGYLEGPSINGVFMCHKKIKKYSGLIQIYFYSRILFDELRLPGIIERLLWPFTVLIGRIILPLLDPSSKNPVNIRLRSLLRAVIKRRNTL